MDDDKNNKSFKEKSVTVSWMGFFPSGNGWDIWSVAKTVCKSYLSLLLKKKIMSSTIPDQKYGYKLIDF